MLLLERWRHYFDDELTEEEAELFENEGIRYYSNVMNTFRHAINKAIEKTEELDVEIMHWPWAIYRKPERL